MVVDAGKLHLFRHPALHCSSSVLALPFLRLPIWIVLTAAAFLLYGASSLLRRELRRPLAALARADAHRRLCATAPLVRCGAGRDRGGAKRPRKVGRRCMVAVETRSLAGVAGRIANILQVDLVE